ncbi:type II secretion system protein G [Micrococcales bacterium KH10]|nr:type II secretion system protein G [Micrococcales bacterium KH10]
MIARIQKSLAEKDKGFTLIELLVVIIIIGILAAIAIPVFLNQRKKAVDSGIKSDLRSVANEIESYYVDNQDYPAASDVGTTGTGTGSILIANAKGDDVTVTFSDSDTTIVYALGAGSGGQQSFTLRGYNDKGTAKDASNYFEYDSAAGGLKDGVQKATTP